MTKGRGVDLLGVAADLTELYTAAEHLVPETVLLSEDMTTVPEFEVMRALFSALNISCVLLRERPANGDNPMSRGLPVVSPVDDPDRFISHVRQAAATKVGRMPGKAAAPTAKATTRPQVVRPAVRGQVFRDKSLIMVGASTGGVDALISVLGAFPKDCPPTLVVQHTGGKFAASLIRLLAGRCAAQVVAAEDGAVPDRGHIYLMPDGDAHLALAAGASPRMTRDTAPAVGGHRPAIDVLFRSGRPFAAHVAAAILTGMGRDGAAGMLELSRAGATTIAQDEATSIVYGMPRVAWEIGAAGKRLPVDRIGHALLAACTALPAGSR